MLLDDRFGPTTDSVGLVYAPVHETAALYHRWMRSNLGEVFSVQEQDGPLADQLERLRPLVQPGITRTIFVAVSKDWTAIFNNSALGTDVTSTVAVLADRLRTTALRCTCVPDLKRPGERRFGARIVEVHRAGLRPVRVMSVANDGGRWVQDLLGEPMPQEEAAWFAARRIQHRFSTANLRALVERLVPGFWNPDAWTGPAVLVRQVDAIPPTCRELPVDHVQRDLPTQGR